MRGNSRIALALVLVLAAASGCTTGSHLSPWSPHRPSLTASQMARCLAEVSSLAPEAVPAEIARLQKDATRGDADDRLKLAYLLSRTDNPTSDPDRAWEILKDLAPAFRDKEAQEIAHLLARTVTLERELQLARSRTAEAQQKIERLKGLERELDDSSSVIEPPPPVPGPTPPATTHGGPTP